MPTRFPRTLPVFLATLFVAACTSAPSGSAPVMSSAATQAAIQSAVADPSRPAADSDRDAQRMPAALLGFAGVKHGDRVADLMPGGGYFTRLYASAVGPTGHVYAIVPSELSAVAPKAAAAAQGVAASAPLGNVSALVVPAAQIAAPEPLDIVWTSQNYHDVYYGFGLDTTAALDRAVYAALKPGGVYVIVDHVATAGVATADVKPLHRIDPALVKAQVLMAGFRFVGESAVLRNAADAHDLKVFDPAIRGRTDQFVYKFMKP